MSDNTEHKYQTRYHGAITAQDLLDRSCSRLRFLEKVFAVVHHDGNGLTMEGYSSCGLAAILEDIAYDVVQAQYYYHGSMRGERRGPEPGKTADVPEVSP